MDVKTGLNILDDDAKKVNERAEKSLKSSCFCLKIRIENTQKLVNNLKS